MVIVQVWALQIDLVASIPDLMSQGKHPSIKLGYVPNKVKIPH